MLNNKVNLLCVFMVLDYLSTTVQSYEKQMKTPNILAYIFVK